MWEFLSFVRGSSTSSKLSSLTTGVPTLIINNTFLEVYTMKKIAILVAALLLCAGCSQKEDSTTGTDKAPGSTENATQQEGPAQQSEAPSGEEPPASMDDATSESVADKEKTGSTAETEDDSPQQKPESDNRKSAEQVSRENSMEAHDTDANIETPEEFLGLPIWEMQREAMGRLEAASHSKTVKQMEQELRQARGLFASLEENIAKLNINDNEDVQILYDMQKKVVNDYTQHIDSYLNSSDPDVLQSLQKVDQAFINFIKTAKEVVAENE